MLLSETVSEFLVVRRVKLAPHSLEQYVKVLDGFLDQCGVEDSEKLSPAAVAKWLGWVQGRGLASKSVVSYFKIVHTFLTWAVREELAPARALHVDPPRLEKKIPPTFQDGQVLSLVRASSLSVGGMRSRDGALVLLLADTGLRASEVGSLTLENLHVSEGYVQVRGKGGRHRQAGPLSLRTQRALRAWLKERGKYHPKSDTVFITRTGVAISRNTLDALLRRLRDKAGLDGVKVGAHRFRHSWARSQALAGADVLAISRLMGHSNLGTTQAYLGTFGSEQARRMVGSVVDAL